MVTKTHRLVCEQSHSRCGYAADIKPWPWVFDKKSFYLIANMAVGGTLGGKVVPEDLLATVEFDWIRVYAEGCRIGLSSPLVVQNA